MIFYEKKINANCLFGQQSTLYSVPMKRGVCPSAVLAPTSAFHLIDHENIFMSNQSYHILGELQDPDCLNDLVDKDLIDQSLIEKQ